MSMLFLSQDSIHYSDLRIYDHFLRGAKRDRQKEYKKAGPAAKKELYELARLPVCASEGSSQGEGKKAQLRQQWQKRNPCGDDVADQVG